STSKTRTAPNAASTPSEKSSRTAAGGVLTVVWGAGSVRRSTAWAAAGPAVDTTRTSTRAEPARARATPRGRGRGTERDSRSRVRRGGFRAEGRPEASPFGDPSSDGQRGLAPPAGEGGSGGQCG